MRKELEFDTKIENKKAYLTRMARLLDVMRNHPEQGDEHPQIAGMTADEKKEFENYLCEVIRPDVALAAKLAASRSKMLDYQEVIANIALASVMEVLHAYNAPTAVELEDGYSFETFIANTIKNSVREAFKEKTGLKKHQLDKANRVRKAMSYIAATTQKPFEEITVEDIFQAQVHISNAKPLSMESIRDVLDYMETQVYIDGIEDFEVVSKDKPFMSVENEETKELLHAMFKDMKKAQQYVFLKRFSPGEERTTYKQLAREAKLIELCMEDEVCKRNLTKGALIISRPKGQVSKEEEKFEDIIFLKVDFMDYLYRDALKRFQKFVMENQLLPSDLEGWLEEWILEELNNL